MSEIIKGKKIFITGGAGFIGKNFANKYCDNNEIIIFDNFLRSTISDTKLIQKNIKVIQGDILDYQSVLHAAEGCDIFIHAAAIAGIHSSVQLPVKTMQVNMLGTANCLEAARNLQSFEKFIDISTSEIFGSRAYKSMETDDAIVGCVGEARWIYAVSKLASEHLTWAYYTQYGLNTITLRPFNIYGPGQIGEGAISLMIRKALAGDDLVIFGDGTQIRAWCFIDDMIQGISKAISCKGSSGESFNIGNAQSSVTVVNLAQIIIRLLNARSRITFAKPLTADIEFRIPSTEKSEKILGYKPQVELEEGILKTAEWIKSVMHTLPEIPKMFS